MAEASYTLADGGGAGLGGEEPTELAHNTDVRAEGLDLLLAQFKGKPRIESVLGLFLDQVQDLEDAAWQLYAETDLATAIGAQLDQLGEIVGEQRDGRTDDDYRRVLRVRIRVNRSKGRPEDLLEVADLFEQPDPDADEYVELFETPPLALVITLFVDAYGDPKGLHRRLREASAAGVNTQTIYLPGGLDGTLGLSSDHDGGPTTSNTEGLSSTYATSTGGAISGVFGVGT